MVSANAKDLISKILVKKEDRLTAKQILEHPWFSMTDKVTKPLNVNFKLFRSFRSNEKLKKIVLTILATQMNEIEINELKDLFISLDKDNDGVLTIKEIRNGLRASQFANTLDIEKVFNSVDTDKSGTINYSEFLAASIEEKHYL